MSKIAKMSKTKFIILFTFIFIFLCTNSHAAIALVAHTSMSDIIGNVATSSAIDTTGATLLVMLVTGDGANCTPSSTISDSKSNTWTALANHGVGGGNVCIYYVNGGPTVGTGHTFSCQNSYPACGVEAFSGTATSSQFDQQNGNDVGGLTMNTGAITPSANNYVVVSGAQQGNNGVMSTTSPVLIITDQINSLATSSMAMGYQIQTTATTVNPLWDGGGHGMNGAVIASFKVGGGGGPSFVTPGKSPFAGPSM